MWCKHEQPTVRKHKRAEDHERKRLGTHAADSIDTSPAFSPSGTPPADVELCIGDTGAPSTGAPLGTASPPASVVLLEPRMVCHLSTNAFARVRKWNSSSRGTFSGVKAAMCRMTLPIFENCPHIAENTGEVHSPFDAQDRKTHREVTNDIRMFVFLNGGKELVKRRHFLSRMSNFHEIGQYFDIRRGKEDLCCLAEPSAVYAAIP